MKVLISGALGAMGREVISLLKEGNRGGICIGGVDINAKKAENGALYAEIPLAEDFENAPAGADVIVDFSNHLATRSLTDYAVKAGIPLVIATTGQTGEERAAIEEASKKIPVFFASNYSLGVALLAELAKKTAAAMPDAEIEIIEKHHNRKLDAPSGTALTLAKEIQSVRGEMQIVQGRSGQGKRTPAEIGIHSVRMGNIVGEHEVIIGTANQTITLKHEAHSRALFAEGALAAAQFLAGEEAGLYGMEDLLK